MKRRYTLKRSEKKETGLGLMVLAPKTLPPRADNRAGCSPVFDQGNEGSCTAHAGAGIEEFIQIGELSKNIPLDQAPEEFIAGKFVSVSRQFIYAMERFNNGDLSEDAGATITDCAQVLHQYGVCPESDWPYLGSNEFVKPSAAALATAAAHKITQYAQLANISQMKGALANGHCFMFGISIFESFESDEVAATGMVPMPDMDSEQCMGGHAVMAVGYDDSMQCFIVRNSWGPDWGDKGYFYLPYAYMINPDLAHDAWVILK